MEAESRPVGAVVRGEARHRDEWDVEFNRIVAFSDGVFAIAITLLVLALEVPDHSEDVWNALLRQRGDLFAYALSFAVLGRLWIAHHRFFSVLDRFDGRLMWLNLLYLAFVAIVPYTSDVLGDYGEQTPAVILYAVGMFGVSLTFSIQIMYASRAGLVKRGGRRPREALRGPRELPDRGGLPRLDPGRGALARDRDADVAAHLRRRRPHRRPARRAAGPTLDITDFRCSSRRSRVNRHRARRGSRRARRGGGAAASRPRAGAAPRRRSRRRAARDGVGLPSSSSATIVR